MTALIEQCLIFCNTVREKDKTDFEKELYEAATRFATTYLRFQDACSQSALIEVERGLNDFERNVTGVAT
jgi:hypothetical protein